MRFNDGAGGLSRAFMSMRVCIPEQSSGGREAERQRGRSRKRQGIATAWASVGKPASCRLLCRSESSNRPAVARGPRPAVQGP